jgi:hypothetical protein
MKLQTFRNLLPALSLFFGVVGLAQSKNSLEKYVPCTTAVAAAQVQMQGSVGSAKLELTNSNLVVSDKDGVMVYTESGSVRVSGLSCEKPQSQNIKDAMKDQLEGLIQNMQNLKRSTEATTLTAADYAQVNQQKAAIKSAIEVCGSSLGGTIEKEKHNLEVRLNLATPKPRAQAPAAGSGGQR